VKHHPLKRPASIDEVSRFIARRSAGIGTAIVVAIAVVSATLVAYFVWWLVTPVMPPHVVEVSATVALVVATPIAAYLVQIIRRLDDSRRAIESSAHQLAMARDEAEYANRCKSRFLASASHELRTPLNAIIGFSEIIMSERFGPPGNRRYSEYVRDIHQSGTHLLGIINDILDLSKLEAGAVAVGTKVEVNLDELIRDCRKTVTVMAEETSVDVQFEAGRAHITAIANERMVRQILLNLLSNAIKFTPGGGQVWIGLDLEDNGDVKVNVRDTGVGMTPEDVRAAIQPFAQFNSELQRKYQGTGLGLSLVKAMVEAHGGVLTIESVPKKGTSVSFTLPRTAPADRVVVKPYAA
jgi:signal transduction histidine kinase